MNWFCSFPLTYLQIQKDRFFPYCCLPSCKLKRVAGNFSSKRIPGKLCLLGRVSAWVVEHWPCPQQRGLWLAAAARPGAKKKSRQNVLMNGEKGSELNLCQERGTRCGWICTQGIGAVGKAKSSRSGLRWWCCCEEVVLQSRLFGWSLQSDWSACKMTLVISGCSGIAHSLWLVLFTLGAR